jgi:hypothetical protein
MRPRKLTHGEVLPLVWDGTVDAYYVAGHVTHAEFRAALDHWFRCEADHLPAVKLPDHAIILHGYGRSVRGPDDEDGERSQTFEFSLPRLPRLTSPWFEVTRWVP